MNQKFFQINKHIKHILKITIFYVLYRIILDLMYVKWVNPIFGYTGFVYEIVIYKLIISYLVVFILIFLIPKTNNKVSFMILQLHFIIMIIPLSSVYALANLSTNFMVMVLFCFGMQIVLIRTLPQIKTKKIKNAKLIISFTMFLFSITTYLYLYRTQGIHLNAFDITQIYDIRSNKYISIGIMTYLITWQYRIINPVLLVISYIKKKYKLFVIVVIFQILLYLMYPHKEVFLSIGLILMALLIARKKYRFDSFFIQFILIASIVTIFLYEVFKNVVPFSVLPVRLIYVPALIKFQHYEFFLQNEKLYYSEGMIGTIFGLNYPYSVPSGFLVVGGTCNANTGYLAYAYDNAGFLGMLIISLIFVFLLIIIDSFSIKKDKGIIFSLLIYPMIILNDGDLLTLLLTGGLFLLIIILFVFKDFDNKK